MSNDNPVPFPELVTSRCLLTAPELTDAPALFRIRSTEEVVRYLERPPMQHLSEAEGLIKYMLKASEQSEGLSWAIRRKGEAELVGTVGFWPLLKEHFRAEVGYQLHPAYWGQGLMREALEAVLQYGFQTLQLHSIAATVNPANTASIRLLEKQGFVREAYFREKFYYQGRFLDSAGYSLLAPDFKARNEKN